MNRHHDLHIEVAVVHGVMSVIFVKLAVPIPVFHVLRNAGFRQVFENAPVLVLDVDHVDRRIELILWQWVTGNLSPLTAFLTALGGGFLFQNRPSGWACAGTVVITADVLGVFWRLSNTLNTPSDLAWTSAISYGRFKSKCSDNINPGCRPLTNELAAWTKSALCTRDITSRKGVRYSFGDSLTVCSSRCRSHMVFYCFRASTYCFKKSLQKSSNPFIDFSGSCLNHNRASPARVMEKTWQVGVVKSFSLGSIWIQLAKAVRPIPRTLGSTPSRLSWCLLASTALARNGLVQICYSPCIRDRDGAGISLGGWPLVSCWTSASKSSLRSLLASLASSPSRRALSLHTSATLSFKPMTASWAISAFWLASVTAASIWFSICSSPDCAPQELPSASGGFLSVSGRVLLVVILEDAIF
ncbi:hypothetical protein PanWU01x14_209790 [Parasponia andersonii]|uniref:Transmembrane protein n=1 Tax=Parasponia andersonii TaxID=3476 RepID=A0A2P5BUB4_PARAD|nr:hypothetical protein PanWU01x14_209790 [Parasponia andersonii]